MTIRILRAGLLAVLLAAAAAMTLTAAAATTTADGDNADAVAAGKALVFNRQKGNCLACHVIAGGSQMGNVGPELNDMKKRFPDTKLLYQRVYDETQFNPMTVMPPFGRNHALTDKEIHDIVAYLLTL